MAASLIFPLFLLFLPSSLPPPFPCQISIRSNITRPPLCALRVHLAPRALARSSTIPSSEQNRSHHLGAVSTDVVHRPQSSERASAMEMHARDEIVSAFGVNSGAFVGTRQAIHATVPCSLASLAILVARLNVISEDARKWEEEYRRSPQNFQTGAPHLSSLCVGHKVKN